VALDIAEPVIAKITPDRRLSEAMDIITQMDLEYLHVVTSNDGDKHVGMLSVRSVHRRLSTEVLAKQKEADDMYARTAVLPS
jgi:Mg/Co/Ni transporter MgtE